MVLAVFYPPRFRWRTQMDEQRKYAILFAATILIVAQYE